MQQFFYSLIGSFAGCTCALLLMQFIMQRRMKKRMRNAMVNSAAQAFSSFLNKMGRPEPKPEDPAAREARELSELKEVVSNCFRDGHYKQEQYDAICEAIEAGDKKAAQNLATKYHSNH